MERLSASGNSSQSGGFASQQQDNGLVANRGFGGAPPSPPASAASSLDARSSSAGGKPIMEGVRITPDTVSNSLLIYADLANYRLIENTLRQVDKPQLQIARPAGP